MHIIATLYHLVFLVLSHIGVVVAILLTISMIRGAVRTGEVTIGGDIWPELSWTISRSEYPGAFWTALVGVYGLLLLVLIFLVPYLLYHDITGREL